MEKQHQNCDKVKIETSMTEVCIRQKLYINLLDDLEK